MSVQSGKVINNVSSCDAHNMIMHHEIKEKCGNDNLEYEVERIIDMKIDHTRNCEILFLVRWAGYGEEDDTWLAMESLSCERLFEDFFELTGRWSEYENALLDKKRTETDNGTVQNRKGDEGKDMWNECYTREMLKKKNVSPLKDDRMKISDNYDFQGFLPEIQSIHSVKEQSPAACIDMSTASSDFSSSQDIIEVKQEIDFSDSEMNCGYSDTNYNFTEKQIKTETFEEEAFKECCFHPIVELNGKETVKIGDLSCNKFVSAMEISSTDDMSNISPSHCRKKVASNKRSVKPKRRKHFSKTINKRNMKTFPISRAVEKCPKLIEHNKIKNSSRKRSISHQSEEKCFPCYRCSYKGETEESLAEHNVTHIEEMYSCRLCSFVSKYKGNLNRHVVVTHKKITSRSELSLLKPATKKSVKSINIEHKSLTSIRKEVHIDISIRIPSKKEKLFHCKLCSFVTKHERDLFYHQNIHNRKRKFHCDSWSLSTTRPDKLLLHKMRMHTGKTALPSIQPDNCTTNCNSHCTDILVATFFCELCSFKASCESDVMKHKLIHGEEKAFSCELCSYSTNHKISLRDHMFIHNEIKAFSCELCSFNTNSTENLRKHMFMHFGKIY